MTRLIRLSPETYARLQYALADASDARRSENGATRDSETLANNERAIAANNKAADQLTLAWNEGAPIPTPSLTPVEASAPLHWAPYLINGDSDGMSDSDIKSADSFVERVGCGGPVGVAEDEDGSHGFCHGHTVAALCPEAPPLGCAMTEYQFLKHESKPSPDRERYPGERTNRDRANRAADALRTYNMGDSREAGVDGDSEMLADMLGDLRHWARLRGVDFDACAARGFAMSEEERVEDFDE